MPQIVIDLHETLTPGHYETQVGVQGELMGGYLTVYEALLNSLERVLLEIAQKELPPLYKAQLQMLRIVAKEAQQQAPRIQVVQ